MHCRFCRKRDAFEEFTASADPVRTEEWSRQIEEATGFRFR